MNRKNDDWQGFRLTGNRREKEVVQVIGCAARSKQGVRRHMQTFPIRRIRCGKEPACPWVSVWYNAGGRCLDVLHIVCDPEDDKIYMEGDDQMVAAWGGAKRILVRESGIEFDLTKKAAKQLYLEPTFVLSVPEKLSGWKKARKLLLEMASYSSGRSIKDAEHS